MHMKRIEQPEAYTQQDSEVLMHRLLSLETEYLRIHSSALNPSGDSKVFKPDTQAKTRLAQIIQEGANILKHVEPLLDADRSRRLNEWKRDKWVIDKFDQEQDAFLRKRPPDSETSQKEPQAEASEEPEDTNSKLRRLGIS